MQELIISSDDKVFYAIELKDKNSITKTLKL